MAKVTIILEDVGMKDGAVQVSTDFDPPLGDDEAPETAAQYAAFVALDALHTEGKPEPDEEDEG